jgi:tetratricopeptide (TPR) repeat protein
MSKGLNSKQKEEVVISYNKLAMEQLQQDNYENSMSYLKQALMGIKSIFDDSIKSKLMAITFNNLGCFFKRMSNYPEALKYLYKSIDLENKLPNESATIAGAHLNICSILSQQGDHSKAIRHGLRSIVLLKSIYKEQPKIVTTMVIAHHNVGTEYQLLGQIEDAQDCLKAGYKISVEQLGPQHTLSNTLKNTLLKISRQGKSPNLEIYKKIDRKAFSPKTRLPIVSANSRSTSQESRKSLYRPYVPENYSNKSTEQEFHTKKSSFSVSRSGYPKKFEIQRPFAPKIFSDEEASVKTDKSFTSLNTTSRRIDLNQHKATEKIAATLIQSLWRGYCARKIFSEMKISYKLKQAELKARRAVEEYEKLKQQSLKSKGKVMLNK